MYPTQFFKITFRWTLITVNIQINIENMLLHINKEVSNYFKTDHDVLFLIVAHIILNILEKRCVIFCISVHVRTLLMVWVSWHMQTQLSISIVFKTEIEIENSFTLPQKVSILFCNGISEGEDPVKGTGPVWKGSNIHHVSTICQYLLELGKYFYLRWIKDLLNNWMETCLLNIKRIFLYHLVEYK